MYQEISKESILNIAAKHLKSNAGIIDVQKVSTGKFNSTFFVDTSSESFVLRIAPPENIGYVFYEVNMMAQEPAIHRLLREKTDVPVPEIFVYDTDHDVIESDYLIMEKLAGTPATEAHFLTPTMWSKVLFQIGQHLKCVHQLTTDRFGYLGAHQPMEPQQNWVNAFEIMWTKMVNQIVEINAYSTTDGEFMMELWHHHKTTFDRPVQSSLLHMDVWHQNILIDPSGNVTGILDWDRALWGDPEIEFAVLDYCSISGPPFWEGYASQREVSPEADIRQIFYYLYEVQKYIIIRGTRGRDWSHAMQYRDESLRIAREHLSEP